MLPLHNTPSVLTHSIGSSRTLSPTARMMPSIRPHGAHNGAPAALPTVLNFWERPEGATPWPGQVPTRTRLSVHEDVNTQRNESQSVAKFIPIMGICRLQDEFRWYNNHWMLICGRRAIRAAHPCLCSFEFGASYSLHPTIQVNGSPRGTDIQRYQECSCPAA